MVFAFRIFLPLAAALYFCACHPVELQPPAETPSRIVLLGELVAGDSLQIRAGRSKAFASATYTNPEFETGIQISCRSGGNEIALTPYVDLLLYASFTTLFSNPSLVPAQSEYVVRATGARLQDVEARVQVPAPFAATVTAAGPAQYNGATMQAYDVRLSQIPAGARFVIEAFQSPAEIQTYFFFDGSRLDYVQNRDVYDSLIRSGESVDLLRDTSVSVQMQRQSIYSDQMSAENTATGSTRSYYWYFIKPASASQDLRLYIPAAAQGIEHRKIIVQIKSVSEDYYNYLKAYELSRLQPQNANNSLLITPTTAAGNVKGGFGIVGGVYLQESRFLY
jgi:hypothetical protein